MPLTAVCFTSTCCLIAINAPSDDTGFLFRDADEPPDPRYLKLTKLVSTPCDPREKVELEYRLLETLRHTQPIDMPTEK